MSEKCKHSTTITDSEYKAFRVEKCTWSCGEYLLSIDDGTMTATYTAAELSRLQAVEAERDTLLNALELIDHLNAGYASEVAREARRATLKRNP